MISTMTAAAIEQTVPSDEAIVERIRAGEVALFEVLMRRNNPRVYRAIRGVLRDETQAEDAMQQAYLRAYAHLDDFAGESAFSTWLVRIALNEALGRLRADRHAACDDEIFESEEATVESPVESPEVQVAAREAVELLERSVDELPLAYRSVFVLRDVEELSTAEAAGSLGISEELVRVRLHRAHHMLRESLLLQVRSTAREAFPFLAPRCNRVVAGVMARLQRTN